MNDNNGFVIYSHPNPTNIGFNHSIRNEYLHDHGWANTVYSTYVTRVSCNFPVYDGVFYFSNSICVEMLTKPEPKILEQMLKIYKDSKWVDFKDVNRT